MKNIYEEVTSLIIEKLKEGVAPWKVPYRLQGIYPTNLATKNTYRGINTLMLAFIADTKGFTTNYWAGFKQLQSLGGHVKKGEKGSMVIFYKPIKKEDGDVIPFIRYSHVWNIDQCELPAEKIPVREEHDNTTLGSAEQMLMEMRDKLCHTIYQSNVIPHYTPQEDTVTIPPINEFTSSGEYYSCLFHEYVHSTGHSTRLDRPLNGSWNKESYSLEELVAEMGASFLCAEAGVEQVIDNSAAYIASWIKNLEKNPKWVITASSKAQKATDYLLGRVAEQQMQEAA